ncbi:ras-related protein rab-14 [Syncephalis fuscata]|nr:ras-related protein rab-14 [Syncephalis fuscata]
MLASPYSHDYVFKHGQTCLLKRFTDRKFNDNVRYTVGVEFDTRIIAIDGHRIKLQIWDTAVKTVLTLMNIERFRSVTKGYYRGAAGAILVYDITRRETFDHIISWLNDVRRDAPPHTVFCLVGNKLDSEGQRQVTTQEAQSFAHQHGSNINVDECFLNVASRIYDLVISETIDIRALNSGVQQRSSASFDMRSSRVSLSADGSGYSGGVPSSSSYRPSCC